MTVQQGQPDPYPRCDVCGRTLLRGEQVHEYLTAQRERRVVCVHCRSRAEASGWTPMALAETIGEGPPSRQRRGKALRETLGRAASRARFGASAVRRPAREAQTGVGDEAPPAQKAHRGKRPAEKGREKRDEPQAKRSPPRRAQRPKRRPKRQPAAQAAERKPRPRRGPEAIMRRAVERFNRSDEPRKVAGLIRSLGEPHAAVTADAWEQLALVTVAWELSWYQWEVSADGDGEPVREVAKGREMSELAEEARAWNAAVAEDGRLRLRSAARRRPAAKKA